jgi:plasmid maintenance system killer protein
MLILFLDILRETEYSLTMIQLCFVWTNNAPTDVEIVDYHS